MIFISELIKAVPNVVDKRKTGLVESFGYNPSVLEISSCKGGWKKRKQTRERPVAKGYYNNIIQELMIEDTPGYREMMRITHDDFLEIVPVAA